MYLLTQIEFTITTNTKIYDLTENKIYLVENSDKTDRLDIFCSSGQRISIGNAWMSSNFHFIDIPDQFQLFSHQNKTKIIEYFERSRWTTQMTKWLDTSVVSSVSIPSFSVHCIGIASNESYKCRLRVQKTDLYRLTALLVGITLFVLGPKLSRNILFYYTSCITIGVFASFLVIFFIIGRYFPRKISAILIMFGSSALMFAFKQFSQSLQHFLMDNRFYVSIYVFMSAFLSFCLSYRFGPVSNPKTLNLMQWFLQSIGLIMIAISSELYEYSSILILTAILWKLIPIKQLFTFQRKKKIKIKLLTEIEFEQQSDVQTKKALEELKAYCLSNECNAWDMISKLKDPIRFSRFIRGEHHLTDNEITEYENSESSHLIPFGINNNINEQSYDEELQHL